MLRQLRLVLFQPGLLHLGALLVVVVAWLGSPYLFQTTGDGKDVAKHVLTDVALEVEVPNPEPESTRSAAGTRSVRRGHEVNPDQVPNNGPSSNRSGRATATADSIGSDNVSTDQEPESTNPPTAARSVQRGHAANLDQVPESSPPTHRSGPTITTADPSSSDKTRQDNNIVDTKPWPSVSTEQALAVDEPLPTPASSEPEAVASDTPQQLSHATRTGATATSEDDPDKHVSNGQQVRRGAASDDAPKRQITTPGQGAAVAAVVKPRGLSGVVLPLQNTTHVHNLVGHHAVVGDRLNQQSKRFLIDEYSHGARAALQDLLEDSGHVKPVSSKEVNGELFTVRTPHQQLAAVMDGEEMLALAHKLQADVVLSGTIDEIMMRRNGDGIHIVQITATLRMLSLADGRELLSQQVTAEEHFVPQQYRGLSDPTVAGRVISALGEAIEAEVDLTTALRSMPQ